MKNENVATSAMLISKEQRAFSVKFFDIMMEEALKNIGDFGHPPKLSRADQLLTALMCWREHRTGFHIESAGRLHAEQSKK